MPEFKRLPGKFSYSGMDVHHPPDLLPPDKCSLLLNLQPDLQTGTISMRPPIAALAQTLTGQAVHSLSRMNNSVPSAAQPFARYAGSGPNVYAGQGPALPLIDQGFSGNPLAFVPYRPAQSVEPWMYTYDSARQQRYKTDGTSQNIGIASPIAEPSAVRVEPLYDTVDNATATWSESDAVGGSIGSPTTVARVPASTTVSEILYDRGSTGMACVAPTDSAGSYSWMLSGSMVAIDSETVVIEQAFAGMPTNTTIAAVQYDNGGSSGLCTVVPTVPLPGLVRNMLVSLDGGTTYVRVLSVTAGPDGSYSFRSSSATAAAGDTLVVPASFRCWTTVGHVAGATLSGNSVTATFTPSPSTGAMSGLLSATEALNLSYAGARPLQNEDYMHVSMAFDAPQFVTEVHVLLDVDAVTNDFTHNYFYYVLRQGDFNQSVVGGATTLADQANAVTNNLIADLAQEIVQQVQPPYPIPEIPASTPPATAQLNIGDLAWLEATFKLNDLTRVGSDTSRTLANVAAIGVILYTDGGTVNIYFGGWWAGGGYGPDCNFNSYGNQAPPIQWRYRYRNSLTGAHSTVSPETRNGEVLRRQAVTLTAVASPDPQVDYIDWERRGGTNPDWHYVGSQPVAAGLAWLDNVTESAAQIGDPFEVTCYQPWPVTDVPHTGTALVTGTAILWQSGDQFNTQWLRGTEIVIGGQTYSLYAPPGSATFCQLAQNVAPPSGNGQTVTFSIPEATIESQSLYGAWLDEANNRVLAVGDPRNPGLMYFGLSGNPDGSSDSGYIEVATPSEPLLNGFYAEGANYVFTSTSLYRVESTPGAVNPYQSYRLAGVEGLAGPWAFDCDRQLLFYWGTDGIYLYLFGGRADSLTATDLYPLFPHQGQPGQPGIPGVPVSIHGVTIYPPNYSAINQLRIAYAEGFAYATFISSNGVYQTLVYSVTAKGWRLDTYTPNATLFVLETGVANPALMIGAVDGNVYEPNQGQGGGTADAGGPIYTLILTPAKDGGDSRAAKQWGDLMLDYATSGNVGAPYGLLVLWDDLLIGGPNPGIVAASSRTQTVFDLVAPPDANDQPAIHRNIAIAIAGTGPILLYEWQPSYLPLPENTTGRVTDWQTAGTPHLKFVQGRRIHANTFGQPKSFYVQYDGYQQAVASVGGPALIIAVNFQGEQTQPYSFPVPFKAHQMRLVPLDDTPWQWWPDEDWIFEPEPEPANYWIGQPTAFGQNGYLHCREMWFPFATPVAGAVVSAIVDGGTPVALATLGASATPQKQYFPTPPLKGRYWQLTATGTGLQIYERDLEFLVKSWGSTSAYVRVKPFGDASGGGGASGAKI